MAVFELKNNSVSIKVNSFGAELCSVFSHTHQIEYIWQAQKDIWARHAPNLFPIVGKLKNGTYTYQSKSYSLSQHGFARDSEFDCIKQTEDELIFELKHNELTFAAFPFQFVFQIKYTLTKETLQTSYSIFNPDHTNLYFSVGAHPAFNCPLQSNETFTDYELVFLNKDSLTIHELNNGLIKTETKELTLEKNRLPITTKLFDHDALVFTGNQINEVSLISKKTKHGVTMTFANWPFFGIWTKPNTNQFVCLEPWHGIADDDNANGDITKKTGIIKVSAQQHFNCSFDIQFI